MTIPKGISVIAFEVHPDEPCWGVTEATLIRKDSRGFKRYQITYVNRNDNILPFVKELDDSERETPPLRIVSMGDDKVGELWTMADNFRHNRQLEQNILERKETSTLISDFITLSEMIQRVKNNQTVFGAGSTSATTQRNGFHVRKVR